MMDRKTKIAQYGGEKVSDEAQLQLKQLRNKQVGTDVDKGKMSDEAYLQLKQLTRGH